MQQYSHCIQHLQQDCRSFSQCHTARFCSVCSTHLDQQQKSRLPVNEQQPGHTHSVQGQMPTSSALPCQAVEPLTQATSWHGCNSTAAHHLPLLSGPSMLPLEWGEASPPSAFLLLSSFLSVLLCSPLGPLTSLVALLASFSRYTRCSCSRKQTSNKVLLSLTLRRRCRHACLCCHHRWHHHVERRIWKCCLSCVWEPSSTSAAGFARMIPHLIVDEVVEGKHRARKGCKVDGQHHVIGLHGE